MRFCQTLELSKRYPCRLARKSLRYREAGLDGLYKAPDSIGGLRETRNYLHDCNNAEKKKRSTRQTSRDLSHLLLLTMQNIRLELQQSARTAQKKCVGLARVK